MKRTFSALLVAAAAAIPMETVAAPLAHATPIPLDQAWGPVCHLFTQKLTDDPNANYGVLLAVITLLGDNYGLTPVQGMAFATDSVTQHCPENMPRLAAAINTWDANNHV
jgi:hypothetical protein